MKTFMDEASNDTLLQLETRLSPSMRAEVSFKIQDKTRVIIYRNLVKILDWLIENYENLYLINNNRYIFIEGVIIAFLRFVKTLDYIKYEEIALDGKYWQWFCERSQECISYSLQIDKDKLIQYKEIAKMGVRQKSELKKRIKTEHIPLDVVDPGDVYSFLKERCRDVPVL